MSGANPWRWTCLPLKLSHLLQILLGMALLILDLPQRPADRRGEMGPDRGLLPADPAIGVVAGEDLVDGVLIFQQFPLRGGAHLVHAAVLIEQCAHVRQSGLHGLAARLGDESKPPTRLHFLPDCRSHGLEVVLGIGRDDRLAVVLGNGGGRRNRSGGRRGLHRHACRLCRIRHGPARLRAALQDDQCADRQCQVQLLGLQFHFSPLPFRLSRFIRGSMHPNHGGNRLSTIYFVLNLSCISCSHRFAPVADGLVPRSGCVRTASRCPITSSATFTPVTVSMPSRPGEALTSSTNGPRLERSRSTPAMPRPSTLAARSAMPRSAADSRTALPVPPRCRLARKSPSTAERCMAATTRSPTTKQRTSRPFASRTNSCTRKLA